jgi:polyhydroxyalkanoate synthesis regulator phasin
MTDDNKGKREGIRDGLRQGVGVLSAFKEAIEETIAEARERGDLRPERAKEAMRGALDKAQEAAGTARERFDFVTQKELAQLAETVSDLVRRVAILEGTGDEGTASPDEAAEAPGELADEGTGAQAGEGDTANT